MEKIERLKQIKVEKEQTIDKLKKELADLNRANPLLKIRGPVNILDVSSYFFENLEEDASFNETVDSVQAKQDQANTLSEYEKINAQKRKPSSS